MLAAEKGHSDVVGLLISAGVDANLMSKVILSDIVYHRGDNFFFKS